MTEVGRYEVHRHAGEQQGRGVNMYQIVRPDASQRPRERMHLDLEADDIEAEARRLEALGTTRYVLQVDFPDLLAQRTPWPD